MRRITLLVAILAVTIALAARASGVEPTAADKRVPLDSMTAAQLESGGDEARAIKDHETAIKYFEAAIRKQPKNAVLYNKLGLSQLKNGDLPAAQANFRNAIKRNSKYSDAMNNLGAVKYMQKEFGAAAKQFKKAVALDETRAVFHVNLGSAWFAQKKLEQAIVEYTRALDLDPTSLERSSNTGVAAQIATSEERAKFQYMLAKIYAQRGDEDMCLRSLRKAKEAGYRDLVKVYQDQEFNRLPKDARLAEIVPPPAK